MSYTITSRIDSSSSSGSIASYSMSSASSVNGSISSGMIGTSTQPTTSVQQGETTSLQDEFDNLIHSYQKAIEWRQARGPRVQHFIVSIYARLTAFAEIHPEFKEKIPEKYINTAEDRTALFDIPRKNRDDSNGCIIS